MANILKSRRKLGQVLDKLNDFTSNDTVSTVLTSEANKLWRAKILLDRITRPGEKDHTAKISTDEISNHSIKPSHKNPSKGQSYSPIFKGKSTALNRAERELDENRNKAFTISFSDSSERQLLNLHGEDEARNITKPQILIFNWFSNPVQYIELQTVPRELEINSEGTWAVINSMGRNTPMYHYTGSETTLQFSISWYSNDRANPQDVLAKCRLLEMWSKSNGYQQAPPLLQIMFGDSGMFSNLQKDGQTKISDGTSYYWILQSASYKLSGWRNDSLIKDENNQIVRAKGYVKANMNPSLATQELIFKRTSARNLLYEDIINPDVLKKTKGISL